MEFINEHKTECVIVVLVGVLMYWYYMNYWKLGKKISDCFRKPVQPQVVEVVSAPPLVEEFAPDFKNKYEESNLANMLH